MDRARGAQDSEDEDEQASVQAQAQARRPHGMQEGWLHRGWLHRDCRGPRARARAQQGFACRHVLDVLHVSMAHA